MRQGDITFISFALERFPVCNLIYSACLPLRDLAKMHTRSSQNEQSEFTSVSLDPEETSRSFPAHLAPLAAALLSSNPQYYIIRELQTVHGG